MIHRAIGEFDSFPELFELVDPAGREVLDYGCGRGYVAFRMAQAGAAHVTAIDLAHVELGAVDRRFEAAGITDRGTFLVGDGPETPFADESFDLVVGSAILHHLDFEQALREIRRVLRPGGEAVFVEPLALNPFLRLGVRSRRGCAPTTSIR